MNILIIDDSLVMRRIHKNILLEAGVTEKELLEAEDGKAAWDIAQKVSIGLFLVDWNMPNLNGLDFVKKLRATETYRSTPIVMITSEAARYNVVEAVQAGVTNYVVKPIKGQALIEKIGKYLRK